MRVKFIITMLTFLHVTTSFSITLEEFTSFVNNEKPEFRLNEHKIILHEVKGDTVMVTHYPWRDAGAWFNERAHEKIPCDIVNDYLRRHKVVKCTDNDIRGDLYLSFWIKQDKKNLEVFYPNPITLPRHLSGGPTIEVN